MPKLFFLSLSSINGAIEVSNDFEFTSEIAMLNFPCRIKKKLHKNCLDFVSMVTLILLHGRTSIILKRNFEFIDNVTRPD